VQLRRGTRLPLPRVTGHVPVTGSRCKFAALAMLLFEARFLGCCPNLFPPLFCIHMF
jgi:hypothetical protein